MSASSCAACGFANPAGALFCGNCGSALGRSCPSCGTVVSPELAFCTSCGAALGVDEPLPSAEERKVVTVVFVDLVGFTSRAELLDPEDVGGLQTPYYARVRKEIRELRRNGREVHRRRGRRGLRRALAHEDDPARAMLAALAVRDAIADMNADDPSLELHVRVAVTTGEALVRLDARPEQGEGIAAGDVLNTASRLQSAAPVGRDPRRRRDAPGERALVEYREADPVVRPRERRSPCRAWEAVTPHRAPRRGHRVPRRRLARRTRDDELATLRDAVAARAARPRPAARHTRRRPRDRQEPTGLGALRGAAHGPERPRCLAPGSLASLRRGSRILGARRGDEVPRRSAGERRRAGGRSKAPRGGRWGDPRRGREARWVEGHLRPLAGLGGGSEPGGDRPERGVRGLAALLRGDRRVERRSSSSSRISTGPTTTCSTSSTTWRNGRATFRSCWSVRLDPSFSTARPGGAAASATRRRSRSRRSREAETGRAPLVPSGERTALGAEGRSRAL